MKPHHIWFGLIVSSLLLTSPTTRPSVADDERAGQRRDRKVVYVTLDGFRWQELFGGAHEPFIAKDAGVSDVAGVKAKYWRESAEERRETLLPFIWNTVAKRGQIFGDPSRNAAAKLENSHKFSYPGYSEMFCGFADDEGIKSNNKILNQHISVMEFLNQRPAFKDRVAAIATWDVFPFILNQPRSRIYCHAGITPIVGNDLTDRERLLNDLIADTVVLWPDNQIDSLVMQASREYLQKKKPRVLFVGLGETDEWAHARRYDRYLYSAHRADAFLAGFWNLLQSLPDYKDQTSLLIACDHGRGNTIRDWTDHGAKVEGAEFVWMAALGPDVKPLGVRSDISPTLSQIASTIAMLVDEDFVSESSKSAKPLMGLFGE